VGLVVLVIGSPVMNLRKQRPRTGFTKEELWVLCVELASFVRSPVIHSHLISTPPLPCQKILQMEGNQASTS
jgi:hypothetical protein